MRSQRAIVGASWDAIKAKRNQKPEVRQQQREQAIKNAKDKKKADLANSTLSFLVTVSCKNSSSRYVQGSEKAIKNVKGGGKPTKAMSSSKR